MQIDITQYENLIFDFGGVILDINPDLSKNAFLELCSEDEYESLHNTNMFWEFEKGEISFEELQFKVNQQIELPIADDEFKTAWTAMLQDYHPERLSLIKKLRQKHKMIMLSNTNQVHYDYFSEKLKNEYELNFQDLFDKVYLSHEMGLLKPDLAIFEQVINDLGIIPEKTLFIEDTKANAQAAAKLGIQTLVIPRNDHFFNYFKK